MNSTTRRIIHETYQRSLDAIANGETEGAEFIVWWKRLAGLNQGTQGPQTWRRLKEITAGKMQKLVEMTEVCIDRHANPTDAIDTRRRAW